MNIILSSPYPIYSFNTFRKIACRSIGYNKCIIVNFPKIYYPPPFNSIFQPPNPTTNIWRTGPASINNTLTVSNSAGLRLLQSGLFSTRGSNAMYGYPWSNLLGWGENGNLFAGMYHTTALQQSQTGLYSVNFGEHNRTSGWNNFTSGVYNTSTSDHNYALGGYNTATAQAIFAIGESNQSRATIGNIPGFLGGAWLIGSGNKADSRFKQYVFQIGIRTQTNANNCFVIGSGPAGGGYLNFSRPNNLGIGFNSTKPTFYVGPAVVSNGYGKVGVGTLNPTVMFEVGEESKLGVNSTGSQTPLTVVKHGQSQTANSVLAGPAVLITKPAQVNSQYGPSDKSGILRISGFTPNNTTVAVNVQDRFYITTNGHVGVNIVKPDASLHVNGDVLVSNGGAGNQIHLRHDGLIRCRSFLVNLQPIPDYVFEPGYKKMDVSTLRSYLKVNKHLPGMSSADEMASKGHIDMTELTLKTLEKLEELYLYVLELEERVRQLEN